MEPTTVIGCVSALAAAFAEGSEHYARWKSKRSRQNHYLRSGRGGRNRVVACALSTSLVAAEIQIKETYDIAFAIVGSDFSTGDATCRDLLCNQLFNLRSRISHLRRAADSVPLTGTLNISDVLQTSEAARVASIQAITGLYRRLAAGRPVPSHLPVPKPWSRQSGSFSRSFADADDNDDDHNDDDDNDDDHNDDDHNDDDHNDDDDDEMTVVTVSTDQVRFQSEPPSPPPTPPTPKPVASDAASTITSSEVNSSIGADGILRPKVSVFSMFCPEAMALQVDLSKPVPEVKTCKCGYRWKPLLPCKSDFVILKEGFRMSRRFLAKSHSDKHAFGCILCVSSGKTETFDSSTSLSTHINSSHTKWQILHERDIA